MTTLWELVSRFANLFVWWTIVAPWEAAIRVRFGKRMAELGPGVHFRIPYFDAIYRQSVRLRVMNAQLQTLSTLDGKTITLSATIRYCISDITKLYDRLHDAEESVRNMIAGEIAQFVASNFLSACQPKNIEAAANNGLDLAQFGLGDSSVRIVDFAVVKTYRLLQDQRWQNIDGLNTTTQAKAIGGLP